MVRVIDLRPDDILSRTWAGHLRAGRSGPELRRGISCAGHLEIIGTRRSGCSGG